MFRRLTVVALAAFFVLGVTASSADTFQVRLVSQTSSTITLGWEPQEGFGYRFYRGGVFVSSTNDETRTSVRFSKITPASYDVKVITEGAGGHYPTVAPDTTPPADPVLSLGAASQTSLTLNWQAGSDNIGVDHYNVYRGTSGDAAAQVKVGETSALSYTFTGLTCATDYSLGLTVEDAAGNESVLAHAIWFPVRTVDCDAPPPPPPPPPPPSSASVFMSTAGDDGNTCTQAAPCRTMNRASAVAACGATVEVAAGSYGDQQIFGDRTCSAGQSVTFTGAAGTRPLVHHIRLGNDVGSCATNAPDFITFKGIDVVWGIDIEHDSYNITVDDMHGGSFGMGGTCSSAADRPHNITIKNSEWGPCTTSGVSFNGQAADCRNQYTDAPQEGKNKISDNAVNVLIENNVIHDFVMTDSAHFECIWSNGGTNVTLRGNRIYNCVTSGIALYSAGMTDWVFENNWWGQVAPDNAALKWGLKDACPSGSVIIRFNSFAAGSSLGNEDVNLTCTNIWVVGNIFGEMYSCDSGSHYLYNLWLNATPCPGTGNASVGALPYVNPNGLAAGDYHLGAASAADNLVPSTASFSDLGFDWDGQPRAYPKDAGADER